MLCITGNTYEINEQEIIHFWDSPHLLKGMRNNFMTKSLVYYSGGKECYADIWQIVELAWKMDLVLNPVKRRVKNITQYHIDKFKCRKMSVKTAAHICSRTLAAWIEELAKSQSKKQLKKILL